MKFLILSLLIGATPAVADPRGGEFLRLEEDIRQQVACLDLVEGNFPVEQQKRATRRLFAALVSGIRAYVTLGTEVGVQDLVLIREYVGSDDILVGVFLGAMLSDDAGLQQEREALQADHSRDDVDRLLWKRRGCEAAFARLPAEREE